MLFAMAFLSLLVIYAARHNLKDLKLYVKTNLELMKQTFMTTNILLLAKKNQWLIMQILYIQVLITVTVSEVTQKELYLHRSENPILFKVQQNAQIL